MTSSGMTESAVMSDDEKSAELAARRIRSLETITRIHVAALAIGLSVAILWLFSDVLLLLFAATLLACQLRGAATFVSHRTRLPYGLALVAVVLVLAALMGGAFYWRGPRLIHELTLVYDQINNQVTALWHRLGDADWLQKVIERIKAYLSARGGNLAGAAAGFVTSTLGNLGSILLILVAGIYLAASPDTYSAGIVKLLPHVWRPRGHEVMAREGRTLRRWFVGQLVDMAAIGIMTAVGLWLLGVPLFLTLGLIAGLCNFVPYIGALAGSVPAIVLALSVSPRTAIYVAILFFAVQTVEGNVLAPLIQKRTVDLPPVLTLLSQTVLGTLFGPFGLILATPITAVALVLVEMIYVETILGDHPKPAQATATSS